MGRTELKTVLAKIPKQDPGATQATVALVRVCNGQASAAKAEGTAEFKKGNVVRAERKYSEGIGALDGQTDDAALALKLSMHSNRAMFKLQLKDYTGAVADASVIISNDIQKRTQSAIYKKALFRRAQARQGQPGTADNLDKAEADLIELVALEPSNAPAQAALVAVRKSKQKAKQPTQQAAAPPAAPPTPIKIVETTTTTTSSSSSSPSASPQNTRSPSTSPTKKMDPVAMAKRASGEVSRVTLRHSARTCRSSSRRRTRRCSSRV